MKIKKCCKKEVIECLKALLKYMPNIKALKNKKEVIEYYLTEYIKKIKKLKVYNEKKEVEVKEDEKSNY